MKFVTAKFLSLMLLACALTGTIQAGGCADNSCAQEERSCCFSSCYECGCNPLYCGAWDLQVQGGVDPIIWRNRGDWFAVTTAGAVTATGIPGPKFSNLFKTPWTVGGQVGYHMSDNTRVYVEFNYIQANAKTAFTFDTVVAPITALVLNGAKYKLFDGYVGARYYWDRWCDRVAFFLGAKVGFTHHKSNTFGVTVNGTTLPTTIPNLYNRNTVVSGGADFGLDFCFCGNWSFVITGAVIASCGPRTSQFITPAAAIGTFAQLLPGGIGTELRFPVTAGIRYSF